MGTYYSITAKHNLQDLQYSIDSILIQFNKELSTYDPESLISKFNKSTDGLSFGGQEAEFSSFLKTIRESQKIHLLSDGKFDPSLMPVINYWGFGYEGREVVNQIDTVEINTLMSSVGLDKVSIDTKNKILKKLNPHTELDFSAIAKGLAVDIVCE